MNKSDIIAELGNAVRGELADYMLGDYLGGGMSRHVFVHPTDDAKVIKVENRASTFQNIREWMIWQDFQYVKGIKEWLAPCHSISHSGTFLVMDRAFNVQPDQVPEKLPSFLTDHKLDNYGMLGAGKKKRFVCRDYGTCVLALSDTLKKWQGPR